MRGRDSIVPLSRSPHRAPGAGEEERGQGRGVKPHADRSGGEAERVNGSAKRPLTVSAPGPGCVAWAYDDGDEQTRWLVRSAGNARREAQRVAGPEACRDEVPGRLRDAAVSEAMRLARWPARQAPAEGLVVTVASSGAFRREALRSPAVTAA